MALRAKPNVLIVIIVCATLILISAIGAWVYVEREKAARRESEFQRSQETPKNSEEEKYWAEHEHEQNQKLYDQCIKIANESYDRALAKIPSSLSSDQKLLAIQVFAQTRDSHKDDCDREYSSQKIE